jgi:predicted transcriptional regulator
MPKLPGLAKSEQEIVRIVWDQGQATVREVYDALPPERRPDFKTVQTYLRRLKAKGYLRTRREGRSDVYRPRIRPQTVVSEVIEDFVSRLFGGDAFPLVLHLVNDRGLKADEVEKLRELLDQKKAELVEDDGETTVDTTEDGQPRR